VPFRPVFVYPNPINSLLNQQLFSCQSSEGLCTLWEKID
jgi:hypothetical protein